MSTVSTRAGAAVLGLCLAVASGCGVSPGQRDVLLITADTLRADHMSLYGYERPTTPQIDRWFADAAVFERAHSTEANTSPSVVSILTGLAPTQHRVRVLYQLIPDETVLLPALLRETHQTAGFIANIVLTDEAMGIAKYFDHYDDHVDERVHEGAASLFERNAERTTDAVLAWLETGSDPERPLFLWVHYIDPHSPYRAPEGAPRFEHDEPAMISGLVVGSDEKRVDGRDWVDAYDGEIAYMDAQVGRLLEAFDRERSLDDALVLFTADHAESMMEHDMWFAHGYHVYQEIIRVPLLLRGPGVATGRFDALVSGVDVVPTVLGFLGLPPLADLPGFDLRQPGRVPATRVVTAEATLLKRHWRTVIQGENKWMVSTDAGGRDVLEKRFYDLSDDPDELTAWAWEDGEPGGLLESVQTDPDAGGLPESVRRGRKLNAPKVSPRATEEQLERLRALGYVH